MASTTQKRSWWAGWRCNTSKMVRVAIPSSPTSNWNLLVADAAAPAFGVFAALMRQHEYWFVESAGGTYNCRKIGGTNSWSLHAYGIAIDLNPSKNPFRTKRHNFPQGFIDDVLATGLFRWGIDFDDPMHWEIDVPPSQIGDDMASPKDWDTDDWAAFTANAGWGFPTLTQGVNAQLALTRTERGINALLLRDATDPEVIADLVLEGLEDGDARAVADELARRLAD